MVSGGSRVPVGRDGLRQLTWHVHDVIRRAQDGGRLPGGWGYRGARVSYEVLVSRDAKDGSVVLNVRISGFEGLAAEPRDWPAVAARLARDGIAAVRLVDKLIGRDRYDPPLQGFTRLDPVMPK